MKHLILVFLLFTRFTAFAIIVRHDVDDREFVKKAKGYPQICHFEMGEGTLIAERWIVTAGHVGRDIENQLANGLKPNVLCNGKTYLVDLVILHPAFKNINQGLANDIALVKINESVQYVEPAKIYDLRDELGQSIVIVGRGDKGTGLTGPTGWDKITRAATNRIDGVEDMWISFLFDAPDSKNITLFEGVSGLGDSGGPAFIESNEQRYLVGISSFQKGQETFGKGKYGVIEYYSRVSDYSKWIEETIKGDHQIKVNRTSVQETKQSDKLQEYAGTYGFRKIILRNGTLFFQRENEPLISMSEIEKDLFLWDDENTKLYFVRDANGKIAGFEIRRRNGEVVKVDKTK